MVVLDGDPGPAYDEVGEPIFSPDGQHLLYPAKREKKWVVVVDGEEQRPEMKEIWLGDLRLDDWDLVSGLPSAHFHHEVGPIYVGRVNKGWSLIISGTAGPEFDAVSWPVFWGGDERHHAYAGALVKGTWQRGQLKGVGQVIVDSETGPLYEGETKVSPRATGALVWVAIRGLHGDLSDPSGYQVGKGLAEGALRSFGARSFGVSSPRVSPDGERVAYAARREGDEYVVVLNGETGPAFESIECGPIFTQKGTLVYVGVREDKLVLVRDGEAASEFSWKDADCTHLWTAPALAWNNAPRSLPNYREDSQQSGISFPDSDHVVYVAALDDKRRVFIDGIPGEEYQAESVIVRTHFIGEELHVAYVVRGGTEQSPLAFVVVDGHEGTGNNEVFAQTLQFSEEGTVTYAARVGSRFFRMTHPRM